jgi:hypothetical protein
MASQAKLTIRVSSARGSSTIAYSTNGRYVSLNTAGFQRALLGQPVQPTTSPDAFWLAVVAAVVADLTAHPTPP